MRICWSKDKTLAFGLGFESGQIHCIDFSAVIFPSLISDRVQIRNCECEAHQVSILVLSRR